MRQLVDVRCADGHVEEQYIDLSGDNQHVCTVCAKPVKRVFLTAPKVDWSSLAMGESASPEAINKFEKMHKDQRAKEEKCLREHGDYGPAPGASTGSEYKPN